MEPFVVPMGYVAAATRVALALMARDVGGSEINKTAFGFEGGGIGGRFAGPVQPANPTMVPVPRSRRVTLPNNISSSVQSRYRRHSGGAMDISRQAREGMRWS